jgi:methylmalonyl-CoA mutase N-terminal domain/subunit
VAAAAIRMGYPIDKMQGSCMPDHLRLTIAGWSDLMPAAMGHRTVVDLFEYCARNSPHFTLGFPQGYDFRENGAHAITEIAVEMAILIKTMEDLIARGVDVDRIAPRLAYVSSSDIDFFEEIAKFRALRRIWARTMKERLGSKDPRSMRLRIACHTSGRSLVYRQPLNNLARAAVQSLAALLGGVQSLEACTYDEPISVPTQEARELAIRTQQILANEVGAARTADPLGGSYYIEALTNEIESKSLDMLAKLEAVGIVEAISTGYVAKLVEEYNNNYQRELDSGERLVIGLNAFAPDNDPPPKRFTFDKGNTEQHRKRFAELKTTRDQQLLRRRIRELYATVKNGQNATQAMIDALLADGSVGEVWGTVRVAHGHSYDLFRTIESPFDYSGL